MRSRVRVGSTALRRAALVVVLAFACGPSGGEASWPRPPPSFHKTILDVAFRAEGITSFDVDRDGRPDVVFGQAWYRGPAWQRSAIAPDETYDPLTSYSDDFGDYGADVDGDGDLDLLVVPFPGQPMSWRENVPSGEWPVHALSVTGVGTETPIVADLFGRGDPVVVGSSLPGSSVGYWRRDPAHPLAPWRFHAVSDPGSPLGGAFSHGLGVGDLDGDGRNEIVTASGWFAGPADPDAAEASGAPWAFHPYDFAPNDCAQMIVADLDGDGLADVVSSSPHERGVWWWRQGPAGAFTREVIDDTIAETHAILLADLDGDGAPEIVTGKRVWAHGTAGTGANEPALLVYYARRGATWERHVIDDDSGVGTTFDAADVDGDGRLDLLVANKKGVFLFTQP